MIENILKYTEFTSGIIFFLFALIQLIYKNKQFININLAGAYFCISYEILMLWAFKSGLIFYVPLLLYTDIVTPLAIGPFVYYYLKTMGGHENKSYIRYFMHFVPALAVLFIVILNNSAEGMQIRYYQVAIKGYPLYWTSPLLWCINIISLLYMICYFFISLRNMRALLKKGNCRSTKEIKTVFLCLTVLISLSALLLTAVAIRNTIFSLIAIYAFVLAVMWYFIFSFRHPEFTQKAIRESRSIRYENLLLNGIDYEAVLDRLDYLMREEKVYIDCELTLQKLSSMLMITPHQLSGILNSKRNMNFRSLVNSYRVKEAMKQMADYREKNILEIALASGFNSKSSFNSVFFSSIGTTPSDYRKNLKFDN